MYSASVNTDIVSRYTLKIVYDEYAESPRENQDNLGTMICWHNRYNLGDKHSYYSIEDFLSTLVRESADDRDIVEYVRDGKADGLALEYSPATHKWGLKSYNDFSKKWYTDCTYTPPINAEYGIISDDIIERMTERDLLSFAERANVIMPLYFYDHSIQSISTESFRGRAHHANWDSGTVGFVYVSNKDIAKEYGDTSPNNIEKAKQLISSEVVTYDCYLRGDCYGFQLYKDGDEVDSCWGFIGSFNDAKEAVRSYLPEDAVAIIDRAEYGDDEPEYSPGAEFIEQGD